MTLRAALLVYLPFSVLLSVRSHAAPLSTFMKSGPDLTIGDTIIEATVIHFPSMCTGADMIGGTICLLTGQLAVTLFPAQEFSIDSYEFRISGSFVDSDGPGGTVPEPSPLTLMLAAGLLAAGAGRRAILGRVRYWTVLSRPKANPG